MEKPLESHLLEFSENHLPGYLSRFLRLKLVMKLLSKILCLKEVDEILSKFRETRNMDMVDGLIDTLGISVTYTNLEKIPPTGRILIISNHPLGGVDGFTMLQGISKVRKDVKIVMNKEILRLLGNMKDLFIPIDVQVNSSKEFLTQIASHLENEEAVIIFPAGAISFMTLNGLRDRHWKNGVAHLSREHATDILPVYIEGRFQLRFYIYPKILRRFLLVRKFLHPRKQHIKIVIGDPISHYELRAKDDKSAMTSFMREKVYELSTLMALENPGGINVSNLTD